MRQGRYEFPEALTISHTLRRDLPVVEFGGGLGVISCMTNRLLRHPERHVVVEMNPNVVPVLESNRRRNDARFQIVHGALGYAEPSATSSTVSSKWRQGARASESSAPRVTLGSVLREQDWKQVNVVLDVEGAEFDLVRQEAKVLAKYAATLTAEVHPPRDDPKRSGAFLSALLRIGFEPVVCYGAVIGFRNTQLAPK